MAKNKKNIDSHYELLYILSNQYTEDEIKPIIEKVNKILTDNDGKITYQEEWGKKKLAYPINRLNHGYYILVEFDLLDGDLAKINNTLRITAEVIRFIIVAKPFKSAEEIKEEKKRKEKIVTREKEEKLEKKKKEEQPAVGKVNLKDLDEKLDKILETDDLL